MAVQVSYPGVYIDEFAPGAPIQGVGTSTAAFIGVAASGDLDEPTKLTSWDQFIQIFGDQPVPGFYLWYAVRGFFQNGGQVCYVVRASNGDYDKLTLNNAADNSAIRVRARQPGDNQANPIQVQVTEAHVVPATTTLFQPTGALSDNAAAGAREITLGDKEAANFKPDDWITIADGGERIRVVGVSGNTLRLSSGLARAYNSGGDVRLADAPVGTRTIRIRPAATLPAGALASGTILTITQGGNSISQIVESVRTEPIGQEPPTYRVTLRQGLSMALSLDPANAATVRSEEFNFLVQQGGPGTTYDNLSIDPGHPRYFVNVINGANPLVRVELIDPPPP